MTNLSIQLNHYTLLDILYLMRNTIQRLSEQKIQSRPPGCQIGHLLHVAEDHVTAPGKCN